MGDLFFPLPKEYIADVLVRFAHHSSGIEGNTISLPDTAKIILAHELPKHSGKSTREFYEIENHREAFQYITDKLNDKEKLSVEIIQGIHERLMDRLHHDNGNFKKEMNRIKGSDFSTVSPLEAPVLTAQLVGNVNYRLSEASSGDEKLFAIVDTHIQFERVHPFSDGNGRTDRMIINYSLLQENLPPLIIEKEYRSDYYDLSSNQNPEEFVHFVKVRLENEYEIIKQFSSTKKNRI